MEARDLIDRLKQLHQEGATEELTDQFAEPLIVFPVAGPSRRAWRKDIRTAVERLLAASKTAGVASLRWEELALETQASRNHSILVRWLYLDRDQALVAHSEVRYFCGTVDGGPLKVHMIEYLSVAFSTVLSDMPKPVIPKRSI
ncbi:MAG: hypothetical protein AAGK71_01990 [Pseudomonadota bacterium]